MKSIAETIGNCRSRGATALIPFITAGFPDKRHFGRLMKEFVESGADLIEVGIPFSDPMADGKSIQFSSQKALGNGVNLEWTFDSLSKMHNGRDVPLIIMSYLNPLLSYGLPRFVKDAAGCGVRGLIIPDVIPEEGTAVECSCSAGNIDLIYLLAPTSDRARRSMILRRSRGFVYLVSVAGVTGMRQTLPPGLDRWIGRIKKESRLPVCVGFGISRVEQAVRLSRHADGIIVGSALIEIIRKAVTPSRAIDSVGRFLRQLRKGLGHV